MSDEYILIVEDEVIIAMELEDRLKDLGYNVLPPVSSGKEALQKVAKFSPDLVLMDIRLKGEMDGITTAAKIREQVEIPIVYLTAHTDTQTLNRAKTTQPFGYLIKPFAERELRITLEIALYKHSMEQKLRASESKYRIRHQEAEALRQAAIILTSTMDRAQVIERILAQLQHVIPYDSALVQLFNGDEIEIIGGWGVPQLAEVIGIIYPLPEGTPNAQVVQSREPVIIEDVVTNLNEAAKGKATVRSWMGVPLLIKEQVIGMLTLDKYETNFYTEDHLGMAKTYAAQAAIAIENARLHAESEQRAHQFAVLHELDQAISASLDINHIYQTLAHHAARLLPYHYFSIALLEGDDISLVYVAGEAQGKLSMGSRVPAKNSSSYWVIKQEQSLLRPNIEADRHFTEDQYLIASGILSSLNTPLRMKGKTVGSWNIGHQRVGDYTPHDLTIARSMADQLGLAMENARLYQLEQEQYRRLQQSQAQLIQTEKMAALGRLVASIAHEINNPIQAVQNCIDLLQEEWAGQQRPKKLNYFSDIAKTELNRIAAIVHRMRDFYHPTQARSHPLPTDSIAVDAFYYLTPQELQLVDIHVILESVLLLANKQLQHNKVYVEKDWYNNLPHIWASPDHLKQIFLNLVLNALDAMEKEGGTLFIRTILNQAPLPDLLIKSAVRIEFEDTGAGIPPEALLRLFEPLFTTKDHGSGFGLFTSYKIIEAHHGQITVESQEGVGTSFIILLPLEQ